jgi:hypothetical protein
MPSLPGSPFTTTSLAAQPADVALLADYLHERCLEPADFPMGLVPMRDTKWLRDKGYNPENAAGRPYIMLDYLRPDGSQYKGKDGEPFRIARFLGPVKLWNKKDPPPKAVSPKGKAPVLHFEPLVWPNGDTLDWFAVPEGTIVVHTESLVKSKVVFKHTQFPSIGLNGVRGWQSSKQGIEMAHTETGVDFSRFRNVILFDSNVAVNKDVQQAQQSLAFKMRNLLGCKDVRIATLPRPSRMEWDKDDWGPDDFLYVKQDKEALLRVILDAEEYTGSLDDSLIEAIRDKVVYCGKTGAYIDRETKWVKDVAKASELYLTLNRRELVRGSVKTTYAFDLLRRHPEARREVIAPCYQYLGEEFVEKHDGEYYNLYRKSGYWPNLEQERTGSAGPVIAQLENLLGPQNLERFRSYMRYVKFDPGKPSTCLVLHGVRRGQGKNWTGDLTQALMGRESTAYCNARVLSSNFNAQLQAKRWVIFNEYHHDPRFKQSALMGIKSLTGDAYLTVEPKGMDSYDVENCSGSMFTTNFIEDVPTDGLEDRRMIYMEAENRVEVTPAQWKELHDMIESPEVLEDFAHWLWDGEVVDYASWKPPMDAERQETILSSSSGSIEGAAREVVTQLREEPEGWVCAWYDTVKDLLIAEGCEDLPPPKVMGLKLKRGDFPASTQRYGMPQRRVYIIDQAKFKAIEGKGLVVRDEADRLAKAKAVAPKVSKC